MSKRSRLIFKSMISASYDLKDQGVLHVNSLRVRCMRVPAFRVKCSQVYPISNMDVVSYEFMLMAKWPELTFSSVYKNRTA